MPVEQRPKVADRAGFGSTVAADQAAASLRLDDATLAALSLVAFDGSYESQMLAGGYRRHAWATRAISGARAALGFFTGAAVRRDPRPGPPSSSKE